MYHVRLFILAHKFDPSGGLDDTGPATRLHLDHPHHDRYTLTHGLVLKGILVYLLIVVPRCLPHLTKVRNGGLGHVIRTAHK